MERLSGSGVTLRVSDPSEMKVALDLFIMIAAIGA
jgi:hypothetical protein